MSNYLKKQPKQDRSKATVEVIIEATTRIVEADGLGALTTNRVAEVAGVSVGSLYQYFPNKAALAEEVRSRLNARFEREFLALFGRLSGLSLREGIREWVHTVVKLHADSPGVHNELGSGTPEEVRSMLSTIVAGYLDVHAKSVRRPDRALAGRVMMGAAEALIHNTSLSDPDLLDDPNWIDEVCDMLERYMLVD